MLIYKDLVSGDELCSDTYPCKEVNGGILLEVKGKMVTKSTGIDGSLIGANQSAEGGDEEGTEDAAVQVVDVVDANRLVETNFDKASYKSYIKGYMKTIKQKLEAENKETAVFMKGAQGAIMEILENFKEYQFFLGEKMDPDGMVVLCKWVDEAPFFYFFKHGLDEEKV